MFSKIEEKNVRKHSFLFECSFFYLQLLDRPWHKWNTNEEQNHLKCFKKNFVALYLHTIVISWHLRSATEWLVSLGF